MMTGFLRAGSAKTRITVRAVVIWTMAAAIAATIAGATAHATDELSNDTRKTVAALLGRWTLRGTVIDSSSNAPAAVTVTMDCRSAARGVAVSCALSGRIAGIGPIGAAAVAGYNADDRRVYWMEISSTGEYHAHRGAWTGATITFEPLLFVQQGVSSTETFSLAFPGVGTMLLRSTTTTPGGSSTIEVKGQRVDAEHSRMPRVP
jgi:hypothetical protein